MAPCLHMDNASHTHATACLSVFVLFSMQPARRLVQPHLARTIQCFCTLFLHSAKSHSTRSTVALTAAPGNRFRKRLDSGETIIVGEGYGRITKNWPHLFELERRGWVKIGCARHDSCYSDTEPHCVCRILYYKVVCSIPGLVFIPGASLRPFVPEVVLTNPDAVTVRMKYRKNLQLSVLVIRLPSPRRRSYSRCCT